MKGAFLATAAALAGTAMADVAHMRRHDSLHHRRALQPEPEEQCGCTTEVITYYGNPTLIPIIESTSAPAEPTSAPPVEATSAPNPPAPVESTVTSNVITTRHSTSYTTETVVVTPSTPAGVEPTGTPEQPTTAPAVPEEPTTAPAVPEEPTTAPAVPEQPTASTPAGVEPTGTPEQPASTAPAPTPEVTLPTPGVTNFPSTGTFTVPATTVTVTDATTVCGATTTDLPSGSHTYGGVTTIVETATTVTCPYATVKPSGSTVTSVIETTTYVCPSAGTYTIAPTTTYVPSSTVVVYPTPATFTPGTYTQPEQVVTVTRTDISYVCPFTDSNEPTSTPAPVPEAPSTTPAVSQTPVAPTTTAVPTTQAAPSSTSSSKTAVPTGVSGKQMGMTYSPYTNDSQCKSKSDVLSDIAVIAQKGFSHVRVYSTDCNSLEYIGEAARKHSLQLIIGVFIDGSGISGAQEQVTAISKWAEWDLVTLIVVGNESIQNGYCSASELAGFIASSKSKFEAAGYSGQITTTEPINVWEQSGSALCSAIDVVGANIHPFFNAEVSPKEAGKFAKSQVKILEGICDGKDVINLETGWPSQGEANGLAVPGASQQAAAIKALVEEVGSLSVFFSYSNDLWKDAGEFDVERYWGCIDQF
ncbi:putative cell wall glucanase (Scw11) [Aspergillus melleus]|uniref:putative cell wall glucanase (Scw11) n=1 Tax=Aspergillus melleus TaxID=138277 RepID=UPI001E8CA8D1|nr:uncharacterized protein LDX57_007520 [Aspergillus melleus]KAH8429849.1 hypothetical protein LDX57_007520 [Aspergillus melleus]